MLSESKVNVNDSCEIKSSRKDYYLVQYDGYVAGICTRLETARACAAKIAADMGSAKRLGDDIYVGIGNDGREHPVIVRPVKRLRMSYEPAGD